MALPMLVNIVAAFSAFWTDLVFSYTPDNLFVRGPLGYTSQICILFYLATFVVGTIAQLDRRERVESTIMIAILFLLTGSIVIEAVWKIRSIGRTSIVLSTVFYYMFFQTREYQETLATEELIHQQLKMQASTDQVTGLLNKTAFLQRLTQALCSQGEQPLALIFFDLDYFKNLNDTLGHAMGDMALQDVGHILRDVFQGEDCFGRFGGDEFCVLLSVTSEEQLTASIGAAVVSPGVHTDAAHLLETADAAAYAVKRNGKDGCKLVTLGQAVDEIRQG